MYDFDTLNCLRVTHECVGRTDIVIANAAPYYVAHVVLLYVGLCYSVLNVRIDVFHVVASFSCLFWHVSMVSV